MPALSVRAPGLLLLRGHRYTRQPWWWMGVLLVFAFALGGQHVACRIRNCTRLILTGISLCDSCSCHEFETLATGLGDFAALSFIPQSVAAPLGGSTMVTNVVLSACWLGPQQPASASALPPTASHQPHYILRCHRPSVILAGSPYF